MELLAQELKSHCKHLRGFAREQGRLLGTTIDQAREEFRVWTPESLASPRVQELKAHCLPEGSAGMVAVRALGARVESTLAQWALDYAADGNGQDFPFDQPYLNFYVRCLYWRKNLKAHCCVGRERLAAQSSGRQESGEGDPKARSYLASYQRRFFTSRTSRPNA